MHAVPLLINIAVALAYALAGGVVARRLGLPTIVGYLLAGVALGPFTPGFRGDIESINQLAELGVILLILWLGGFFAFHVAGGLIHLLLIVAVIVLYAGARVVNAVIGLAH